MQDSRRKFIGRLGGVCCALGIGVLSQAATACVTFRKVSASLDEGFLTLSPEAFENEQLVLVKNDKLPAPIALYRRGDKEYDAYLLSCTHKSCELESAGQIWLCPCHDSSFDDHGKVLNGPANMPLRQFVVESSEDEIRILINQS